MELNLKISLNYHIEKILRSRLAGMRNRKLNLPRLILKIGNLMSGDCAGTKGRCQDKSQGPPKKKLLVIKVCY